MGRAEELFEKLKREGETAINEFIEIRKSEELYLDFKRSRDNGSGKKLHDDDINNLAKAIAGFGNSEGGVVVWGVDASPDLDGADVAKFKNLIVNVARFVSWLEATTSGRTVPAHSTVQNHAIDTGGGDGFVATLIPLSNLAPHQTVPDLRYYMRAGSSFAPVPHAVLAGMFGRRPQARLVRQFVTASAEIGGPDNDILSGTVIFQLLNKGLGIARDLYSDVLITLPQRRCEAQFSFLHDQWSAQNQLGLWHTAISNEGFRLAPASRMQLFRLRITLRPPFELGDFYLKWTFGCEGAPVTTMEVRHSCSEIESLYRQYRDGSRRQDRGWYFEDLFKLSKPDEQGDAAADQGQR